MTKRADNRKYHYTYKVTCSYNDKVFYGLYSTDDLEDAFKGRGYLLSHPIRDYGLEAHNLERIQIYPTRAEAKAAYNELKAQQLSNPSRPEDKKFHFVYKTTRFDGKYYIGIHSTDNLDDGYMGSGTYIGRSLKKHGRDKHVFNIVQLCDSRNDAFDLEEKLVTEETLKDPLCMNQINGGRQHGERVYGFTEESLKKISEASKRNWEILKANGYQHPKPSTETIEKRRQANVGRKRTPEQCANVSKGLQGYHAQVDPAILQERGQRGHATRVVNGTDKAGGRPKGIPMTEEQKIAQSIRTKGKALSEEHKFNLSKPKTRICCLFCQKDTTTGHLSRYHSTCA